MLFVFYIYCKIQFWFQILVYNFALSKILLQLNHQNLYPVLSLKAIMQSRITKIPIPVKLQHNTQINQNSTSKEISFEFNSNSYHKNILNTLQLSDPSSDSDLSQFETNQEKRKKSRTKNTNVKKSSKKVNQKVKKQSKSSVKLQHYPQGQENRQQYLRHKSPFRFGMDSSQSLSKGKQFRKQGNKKGSRKQKSQNKELKIQQKEENIFDKEVKIQVKINESSGESLKSQETNITQLVLKYSYHIIDFKSTYNLKKLKRQFKPEKDILYLFVPKYIEEEMKEKRIPKQILLTGEQIAESQQLFIEMIRFYQNMSDLLDPAGILIQPSQPKIEQELTQEQEQDQ